MVTGDPSVLIRVGSGLLFDTLNRAMAAGSLMSGLAVTVELITGKFASVR